VTPAQAFVERHFSVAKWAAVFEVRWEAERHTAFLLRKGLARGKSAVVASLCRRSPKCGWLLTSPNWVLCSVLR
jgi:hypothetical protein